MVSFAEDKIIEVIPPRLSCIGRLLEVGIARFFLCPHIREHI